MTVGSQLNVASKRGFPQPLPSQLIMYPTAEMKVYELMLKADGIVKDKLIMKGEDVNEK